MIKHLRSFKRQRKYSVYIQDEALTLIEGIASSRGCSNVDVVRSAVARLAWYDSLEEAGESLYVGNKQEVREVIFTK